MEELFFLRVTTDPQIALSWLRLTLLSRKFHLCELHNLNVVGYVLRTAYIYIYSIRQRLTPVWMLTQYYISSHSASQVSKCSNLTPCCRGSKLVVHSARCQAALEAVQPRRNIDASQYFTFNTIVPITYGLSYYWGFVILTCAHGILIHRINAAWYWWFHWNCGSESIDCPAVLNNYIK
mgnify:FL=1